jgi:hypothetical protein
MLFLLNNVVFDLDQARLSPKMAATRFSHLTFAAVNRMGQELYAEHPLLHLDRPDRARRLATLIVARSPTINAALFVAPRYGCGSGEVVSRYMTLDLDVMQSLAKRQDAGALDTLSTDRQVWRRLAA